MSTPFSIAMSPGHLAPIHEAGTRTLQVWNVGSQPVTLAGRILGDVQTAHGCGLGPAVTWARVSPATITLQPRTHENVKLSVTGAPGGSHGLVVEYMTTATASAPGTHVSVAGAVGSQVLVTGNGKASAQACAHIAVPASHTSSSFPVAPVAGGGGALAVALVAALVFRPFGHKGKRHARRRPQVAGRHA